MAKLSDTNATKLQAAIEYRQYLVRTKDKDVHNPQNWVLDDYRQWVLNGRNPLFTNVASTAPNTPQAFQQQTSTQVQIQKEQDD